ncbi:hypothetical protein BDN72DRAFT_895644 [Pluteus cervinus]|uniref:Uncharacterized protein n=1 Tax=Pluteus cervinus TaxID=181527 RepID=A0ACD3B1D4_9AGAR|nr:hypothetical protein BDN72DRAFT_895644 [Pluteus cervinus]
MLFTQIFGLAGFLAVSSASVISAQPQRRDVWNPRVLYPNSQTTWQPKDFHNVTWSLADEPAQITNPIGFITVQQVGGTETIPLIIQNNFELTAGRVEVQVPWLFPGQYQLILFGDSGNLSENFTIGGTLS